MGISMSCSSLLPLLAQLLALRGAMRVARSLRRELVLPRLRCFCDRDPAGATSLLENG